MSKISAILAMIVCVSLVAAYSPVQGAVMDALHKAALGNAPEVAELILSKGAKVNEKNADGDTALHILASAGLNGCSSTLLKRGSDVRAKNSRQNPGNARPGKRL